MAAAEMLSHDATFRDIPLAEILAEGLRTDIGRHLLRELPARAHCAHQELAVQGLLP